MPRTLEPSTIVELPVIADEDIDAFFEFEDLWAVIVWNDDVTTFQTVIQAFVEIFGHTVERADKLAWRIHRTGKAVAAVRPRTRPRPPSTRCTSARSRPASAGPDPPAAARTGPRPVHGATLPGCACRTSSCPARKQLPGQLFHTIH